MASTCNKVDHRWPEAATKLLIVEYQKHPLLYDPKHAEYKNRSSRLKLYGGIANVLKENGYDCSIKDVKAKINGLRSQYLAEKTKILNSINGGAVGDDVYKPTVYSYYMLNFLDERKMSEESSSTLEESDLSQQKHVEQLNKVISSRYSNKQGTGSLSTNSNKHKLATRKISRLSDPLVYIIGNQAKKLHNEDSLDTFLKFIGDELKSISDIAGDTVMRQAKRKIQHAILQTWDTIEEPLDHSSFVTPLVVTTVASPVDAKSEFIQ